MSSTNNTRQAAWVALGSLFSYGFTLISGMILSRYFEKPDYGTYQQVIYVYNTLLAVFTLGLPRAYSYFLPRINNEEAKATINKITRLFFLLGFLFSVFLFIAAPLVASFLNNPDLTTALRIFSPVPFLMLPTMGLEGILATYQKSKLIALYTSLTRFTMLMCVTLPAILWHGSYSHSLVGFVLSSCLSFLLALYLKYYPIKSYKSESSRVTYKDIIRFSLPLMFASLGGILINSTDQFFISRYFGKIVFAEFSNGAIELPFATLIISVTSTVLLPLLSRMTNQGETGVSELTGTWRNVFQKSAMLIYPLLIFCLYDARHIMYALYGTAYIVSSDYFTIKILYNFLKVLPYASVLIAINETSYYAKTMFYTFIALATTEAIAVKFSSSALFLVSIHTFYVTLQAGIYIRHIAKKMNVPLISMVPLSILTRIITISLIAIYIAEIGKRIIDYAENPLFILAADFFVYVTAYLLLCRLAKIHYGIIIRPLIK